MQEMVRLRSLNEVRERFNNGVGAKLIRRHTVVIAIAYAYDGAPVCTCAQNVGLGIADEKGVRWRYAERRTGVQGRFGGGLG